MNRLQSSFAVIAASAALVACKANNDAKPQPSAKSAAAEPGAQPSPPAQIAASTPSAPAPAAVPSAPAPVAKGKLWDATNVEGGKNPIVLHTKHGDVEVRFLSDDDISETAVV